MSSPQDKQNKIFGVAYGIGLNINNVIGSGIVTTLGIIWNMVNSPGTVLLLWLIGGIVSMAGSLSYVELGVIHKISGGERKYLQTAYPKPKILMSYLFSFTHIFAIRNYLQSAAQYSWFTINGRRYDEAGIYRLASNWSVSRFNWEHPINGGPNILAYSSSILLIMFSYDGWNTLNLVPQESISNNNNIDETIAATFFYRLFGKSVVVVPL
ncbi:unnamed protein product [Rhizophagus irregularis]|uniref:High-affinity methionine permease n=1 Tax=Rhizophagus irregularis TaxID=588596 RepID=A0A916E4J6_9GLOM|nr:unnamed protein product [Rhizophagus irregularis]CAB5193681.1 unnamed protein product [Rhizophagus irregularis]CAB5360106.1 unnamed protein product [Rhizophagus irregularis]